MESTARQEHNAMFKIISRAERMAIMSTDRISLLIDLTKAKEQFELRLDDLLNADDYNFAHDIVGIQNNINRRTGLIENSFVPRFSGKERKQCD